MKSLDLSSEERMHILGRNGEAKSKGKIFRPSNHTQELDIHTNICSSLPKENAAVSFLQGRYIWLRDIPNPLQLLHRVSEKITFNWFLFCYLSIDFDTFLDVDSASVVYWLQVRLLAWLQHLCATKNELFSHTTAKSFRKLWVAHKRASWLCKQQVLEMVPVIVVSLRLRQISRKFFSSLLNISLTDNAVVHWTHSHGLST